jgi:hypothetical protein
MIGKPLKSLLTIAKKRDQSLTLILLQTGLRIIGFRKLAQKALRLIGLLLGEIG